MTIPPYGAGALGVQRASETFRGIKADLATVQDQLSTGKMAETWSGLGPGASAALKLRARLSSIGDCASNVADAQLRVQLVSAGSQRIAALASALPRGLAAGNPTTIVGQNSVAVSAEDGLSQSVDIFNTEVDGRYLFAGRASARSPVASTGLILDGDPSHAGLKTLIAERKAADLGADGLGRLALSSSGSTVTLFEAGAGLPFGFKIAAAGAAGSGVAASRSAGPPASAGITVGSQPAAGDEVDLTFDLPDGTQASIRLVAFSGPTPAQAGTTSFALGATAAGTAANLASALGDAVRSLGATVLASASAMKAASDFFDGTASQPTARVAGPPYDTSAALVAGTSAETVVWYSGDASGSPRETAPVRIGDGRTIGIGASAYEPGFRTTLAAYAVLAAESFPAVDPTSSARYAALSDRVTARIASAAGSQAVQNIATDFASANATLSAAKSRLATARNQIQDTLSGIEDADPTEAAAKLLATQTRLQASYQTTATLRKLSLVNYL